jgi:serine/threonine protein kinase
MRSTARPVLWCAPGAHTWWSGYAVGYVIEGVTMPEDPIDSDTQPATREGSQFGHYRLRRLLGRGGFGEVYEADDTVMDRVVALKLLAPAYSRNELFRLRLIREARAAGRLHEPHVVPVHHCGEIDGQLYIDMRLIPGTDLQTVLADEKHLSPARAVAIVRQIAAALDAAHDVQMVHRDVKPANILLTNDDFACLVDFGLANAATDAKLTSSGMTLGGCAAPRSLAGQTSMHWHVCSTNASPAHHLSELAMSPH